MAKKNTPQKTQEELIQESLKRDVEECVKNITLIGLPKTDRKVFKKGEFVIVSHNSVISAHIEDIVSEGIYNVSITYNAHIPYSSSTRVETINRILCYTNIFKKEDIKCDLEVKKEFRINFIQQTIDSLLGTYIQFFGVDFDPEYQRELVWSEEDEIALIESIFNHVDIGKFVFIQRPFDSERKEMYEVLDGKQRLTALWRFYTDQFKYKGYYYSQLSAMLKYYFREKSIAVAIIDKERVTEKDIYDYFIRLNTGGKPVDINHLNKVKQLFENC